MSKSIAQRAREARTREDLGRIVLDLLASRQPRRAVEIAHAIGRERASASRVLRILEIAGKVRRVGHGPATEWELAP